MMNFSLTRKQALISRQDTLSPRCATPAMAVQSGVLARLSALSRANTGWIVVANAPGRLCRQTMIAAGLNPARIIDAHRLTAAQLQRALSSPAIAAVICWQEQDGTFLRSRQANGRLFVIGPSVPASPLH
ncbi:cell division inhibitor [Oceanimonas baumannii]|uniref:cell division inhibitor n=1 Tax=Oceanimonas baumannii TaxID=129578 RepID=UPI001D1947BF|nr:cell division inhibitor [Oceanimonas baumannii]MCC4263018.1 cell division inhibitor [Oceanimonas baumannii]